MRDKYLLVVGDKFAGFAAGKDAVTVSQLHGLFAVHGMVSLNHDRLVLVPGQGLGDDDMEAVLAAAPDSESFDLRLWRSRKPRAAAHRSHKKKTENTLISEPRRIDTRTFELDLLVDQDCELMRDHQTGQHLQGMLLVEAARQSFLAVSEAFFLPENTRHYFIFDSLSVAYKRFVFPVDAVLIYTIREHDSAPNRQRFDVEVAVEQCGAQVAVVSGSFTVVKDARMTRMEAGMAADVLASHLAQKATHCDAAAPLSALIPAAA